MELVERLAAALARKGVDLAHPLALSWYNHSIPPELGACIPARGAAGDAALCVLVGNSRALWEPFLAACATEDLLDSDNPLDSYLQRAVCGSLESCAPGLQHRIYWSHRRTDDLVAGPGAELGPAGASEHVAFQRMAHHAGLAYLDESSHLCLHPRFGPWFSLRCVIIFDNIPWGKPQPRELPNPLPTATQHYVKMTLHSAVHNTSKKFHLPEVDVEAAEAALAEANIEPVLEEESESESESEEAAEGGSAGRTRRAAAAVPTPDPLLPGGLGPVRCPSSTARSEEGSKEGGLSAGSTPTCSSGASTPRGEAAAPAGPEEMVTSAADRLKAVAVAIPAAGPARSRSLTPDSGRSGSPGGQAVGSAGSSGSSGSRRSSLDREGRPCIRAVAANWRAWVAVRDSPCPGHPMRYSEEQIVYHYTRDRAVLAKALLRRGCVPHSAAPLPSSGLLDPAYQAYHSAAMEAQKTAGVRRHYPAAPVGAEPIGAMPAGVAAEPISAA